MLHQILQEIEAAQGPLNLNELSHKLAIERGALEGMIQYWVRKGRLKDDNQPVAEPAVCATGSCGQHCSGPQGCPFVMKMPQTYSLTWYEPE
jgi:hypothetical protein